MLTRILSLTTLMFSGLTSAALDKSPNFLVIVADDMGWSDTQPFGGEINTPNIARLAETGMRMTDFYVAPTCSPTRSMLMTGADHHKVGLGTMKGLQTPHQRTLPTYQSQLMNNNVTVAEALLAKGYKTLMAGKWHLASDREQFPHARGFEHSFTLLEGGASHFSDAAPMYPSSKVEYFENGQPAALEKDFYSSIGYTNKVIEYLKAGDKEQPFFAYVAYTAPHDPLQVPDAWLDRYDGEYDQGPDAVREARLERLAGLGLIQEDASLWQAPSFPKVLPLYKAPWSERSKDQRDTDSRSMEVYAAMIELMDEQIGRIITHLDETGQLENTYVLFFSDNGSSAATPLLYPGATREWYREERDHKTESAGKQGSHVYLGQEWAVASNSPWRLYKATVGEGGVRSPLIVSGPSVSTNSISQQPAHITDITKTIYSIAGVDTENNDLFIGKVKPQGRSMQSTWENKNNKLAERAIGFELFGNKALRKGPWKASFVAAPLGSGRWELHNLDNDPSETQDLGEKHPEMLESLIKEYQQYATDNGVVAPEINLVPNISKLYTDECEWFCQAKFFVAQQALRFM